MLKHRRARWSNPFRFNDPFDCYFCEEPKFDLRRASSEFARRFIEFVHAPDLPELDPSSPFARDMPVFRQLAATLPSGLLEAKLRDIARLSEHLWTQPAPSARATWQERISGYRIFCVCAELHNLLLWAHYSDSHRGVALELNGDADRGIPLSAAERVLYSKNAPGMHTRKEWIDVALGLIPLADGGEVWKQLVLTKSRDWAYEKEWRIVARQRDGESGDHSDYEFDPSVVARIYLGCKISARDRAAIIRLAKDGFGHAEILQAKQAPTKFRLTFEPIRHAHKNDSTPT